MSTIVEFITARLDEDEQVAQAAQQFTNATPWKFVADPHGGHHWAGSIEDEPLPGYSEIQIVEGVGEAAWAQHIARRDPARALLEVKAWRGVIDYLDPNGQYDREIFADIAAIWREHPDYQEEWTP